MKIIQKAEFKIETVSTAPCEKKTRISWVNTILYQNIHYYLGLIVVHHFYTEYTVPLV